MSSRTLSRVIFAFLKRVNDFYRSFYKMTFYMFVRVVRLSIGCDHSTQKTFVFSFPILALINKRFMYAVSNVTNKYQKQVIVEVSVNTIQLLTSMRRREKFRCPNTLSVVSFAGMTLDKCIVLRIGTLTGCPLCRESHPLCRLKNPTVISIWLLVGFHPATRSVQCTPADNARKRAPGSI